MIGFEHTNGERWKGPYRFWDFAEQVPRQIQLLQHWTLLQKRRKSLDLIIGKIAFNFVNFSRELGTDSMRLSLRFKIIRFSKFAISFGILVN